MIFFVVGVGMGGIIIGLVCVIWDLEVYVYFFGSDCSNFINGKFNGFKVLRILILVVDLVGFIFGGGELGNYEVEGIGYVDIYYSR